MIGSIRQAALAIASFIIAALCMTLLGGFVPQLLGPATNFAITFVLGYVIFRDIVRRERRRNATRSVTG